jgi:hypothetical protein
VNVADEREQVSSLLNEKGLVSTMEEVSYPLVALVEALSVGAMKRKDDPRQWNRTGLKSKVHVIRHQAVGIETKTESVSIICKPFKVKIPVGVVSKDLALFVSTRDDVVDRTRKFQALDARHQQTRRPNGSSLNNLCRESTLFLQFSVGPDAAIQR